MLELEHFDILKILIKVNNILVDIKWKKRLLFSVLPQIIVKYYTIINLNFLKES